MALIQKRSYQEVTVTVEEQSLTETPILQKKKIRLTNKLVCKSLASFTKQLEGISNSNDALQILIEMSDTQDYEEGDIFDAIKILSIHFRIEKESAVRVKILFLFSDFAAVLAPEGCFIIDEILILLKNETSAKVVSQGLKSLHCIGKLTSETLPIAYCTKFTDFAKAKLSSPSHNVQRHSILLIGAFSSDKDLLDLISKYTDSQDARVRAQAISSIMSMGKRSVELSPSLYHRAENSLKDDYECVRKEALELICEIGNRHPEHLILLPESQTQLRLIDDAFGKICSSISDLSMQVRTQAAELLGGMVKVNSEFLRQTLDKKLMSNMRRKKSSHERAFENFTSGEWSSGKKWGEDAPKEFINSESISLIESGACGALVQGLEDEYLEVRTASVNSICKLALINPPFAELSLDFLVDMFNDEIEGVRLQAIYSLTKISEHIVLREDQLEIMLGSLEDYSVEVREELHLMLGACRVSTRACLTLVVQKVLDVLSKYPQDKLSAYGCLQRVGRRHPELCMSLTPQLLQDHPFFDSTEKDVEDPAYVCILITLFNAAQHLPPMLSLFPETIIKHYAYLRDTMPNFVPHLPIGDASKELTLVGSTGSRQFLETLLTNIKATYTTKKARQALLGAAQENLDRLSAIDADLSGCANFTGEFLGAQLLIEQLIETSTHQNRTPSKESLNQLIKKCLKLQNLFSNLTTDDLLLVKQICLRASALNLVIIVKDKSQSALAPCQLLLHIATDSLNFLHQFPKLCPDSFTLKILTYLDSVNDPKPGRVFRGILPIVQSSSPVETPQININIKMCTAKIIEPNEATSMDNILKVTAGLIAALPLYAEIENLQESQRHDLRVKIKYPDQNVHIVVPRLRDLKKLTSENGSENSTDNNWRLRTQILLSHGIWTEASQVEIAICLSVRPNSELELCKPIKVYFAPKPIKRGI